MILFIAAIIGIILGLLLKKDKVIFFYQLLIAFLLFGWSYGNADYFSYENKYNLILLSKPTNFLGEPIFYVWMYIFKHLNLSYQTFLIFYALVAVVLIGYVIYKNTTYINYALSLYLILLYPFCVVQIRTAIAYSLVAIAMRYMSGESKNIIRFIIIILIAGGFHVTSLIFLALPLLDRIKNQTIILIDVIAALVLMNFREPLLKLEALTDRTYRLYQTNNIIGSNIVFILFAFSGFAIYEVYLLIIRHNNNLLSCLSKSEIDYMFNVEKLYLLMLINVALVFISGEFSRMFRYVFLPELIAFSPMFKTKWTSKIMFKNTMILAIAEIIYCIYFFYINVYVGEYQGIFEPIFYQNLLFK